MLESDRRQESRLKIIANAVPHYEERPQQDEMSRAVESALEKGRSLLVEAGTGIGKSFAYLVPAIFYAVQNKKKVIVSTHTIHLQEQLLHKDLPILKKALPFPFKAVLVKGRGNYISLRRLAKAGRESADLFERAADFLEYERLKTWTLTSEEGSSQDISPQPSPLIWDRVQSDADNCLGRKCSTYTKCFYYAARRQIETADLLIVNHALFFANLALGDSDRSILPQADCVIFDEAHAIEAVATEQLGFSLSKSHIRYLLTRLYHPRKKKGILTTHKGNEKIIESVTEALKENERLFLMVQGALCTQHFTYRIRQPHWVNNSLHEPLNRIYHELDPLRSAAETQEEELELNSWMKKISALQCELDAYFEQSLDDYVYWIEPSMINPEKTALCAAPVDVAKILKEQLFDQNPRVILTSATLAAGGDFSYMRSRLGIEEADELILDSPFDYEKQMTLHIPSKMPHPEDGERYFPALIDQIKEYLLKTGGRAFVLFTNYSLMNQSYEVLLPWMIENQMQPYRQGDGIPRHQMVEAFKKSVSGVLFGTDSFWSGVDVRGEALSNVIITKLPFAVPDHPVTSARYEKIRARGGDPFLEYALPQAVMKFKQGFGRLIRTKNDTGRVVVLDSRILTRYYGRSFLDSLPQCKIERT